MKTQNTSRRDFLKISGKTSVLLAIGFSLPQLGKAETIHKIESGVSSALGLELNPYIAINDLGKITLFNPRPDMGQGTWQSMASLLAEELEVSLDQVEIKNTDGQGKYGSQLSGGSSSVRTRWLPMRKAGAAVKEMLIKAAAQKWSVAESECVAENAKVLHKASGKIASYAELVEAASKFDVPKEPKLKDSKDFKILGKSTPRPEIPSKVNGTAVFGMDAVVPNMLYASIERSPVIHGKVVSFDDTAAKKVVGVKHVIKAERAMPHKTVETIAVLADTYWGAVKARKALKVQWDNTGFDKISTDKYFADARETAKTDCFPYKDAKGDFAAAFSSAKTKVQAQYETPFLAHAPMEPENAVAWVQGDKVELWVPVQGPDGTIGEIAHYLKIKPENVKVNVTFLGGAFGRKAYIDFVKEACFLSKQVNAPVKVIWTREDDTLQGPFRPGMVDDLSGGFDEKGNLVAFQHKIVGESIQGQVFGANVTGKADDWALETVGEEDSPYDIPNRRHAYAQVKTEIPIVWWRSVYSSTNAFGHESFIDELAHAANVDPLAFRLEKLGDAPRFVKVLTTLAHKANYHQKLPEGQAIGIAIARSFSTICAHAITVSKKGNGVKIEKVVSVIDCGMTVNPNNVKAQTEGNIVMGITAAVKNGITIVDGVTQQSNFHQYNVLRMSEMPTIDVHIIESKELPGGVGEPGLPPIAPALCNAVFNLTGKRVRKLPFDLENV